MSAAVIPCNAQDALVVFSSVMIRAQMLSELEEIMQYKEYADQPWRQASMKRTWMKRSARVLWSAFILSSSSRLHGCQREVEYWQRILQVRSLVLSPGEDTAAWTKFANICRKSDRIMLAEKAIGSLIDLVSTRIEIICYTKFPFQDQRQRQV